MSYLLDTNVISEHSRPRPNAQVMAWLRTLPIEEQLVREYAWTLDALAKRDFAEPIRNAGVPGEADR